MSANPQLPACTACPGRRTVLAGVGAGALALAVSGCAVYDQSAPAAPPPSRPPASAGASASGEAGADQQGTGQQRLAAAADVPVGGGLVLADAGVVLTRTPDGEVRGFSAVCTHAGCTVDEVSDGLIRCPCHGSTFSAADGSVQGGPAPSPLAPVAVAESGADVVRA